MIIRNLLAAYLLLLSLCVVGTNCFYAHYSGDKKVDEGDSFSIECIIDDIDDLKWTKDGETIDEKNGYSFEEDVQGDKVTAELNVESATKEHSGDYRCNRLSRDFHHVQVGDEKDKGSDDLKDIKGVLKLNTTIELHCEFGSDDNVELTWYKDYVKLEDEGNDNLKMDGQNLTIFNADEGDGGNYMCKIESIEDRKESNYIGRLFEILSEPGVRNFPPFWSVIDGYDLVLECDVYGGNPKPVIRWFIGNEAIEDVQERDHRIQMLPNDKFPNAILVIESITYADRNLFTCEVENFIAEKETSTIVTIRENMIKTNEEESGKGLLLGRRGDLLLQCNTTECKHCNVQWLKDGDSLDTSDKRIHVYDENNSVIITDATEEDTGNYMCIVDKEVIGHVINATIAVRTKTEIKPFPRSINSVQGDKLTLYCNITSGRPIPTIVWYKDGQLLNDSDNHIKISDDERGIKDSYLIIEELEFPDRAHYTCEANNVINSANTTVFVRVKDKLAALWPFLGICAEVAILCTIIFVYEKRKVKETEESDTDNPESKSIPERERSQDIRQRK